jgi:hypothetical protein
MAGSSPFRFPEARLPAERRIARMPTQACIQTSLNPSFNAISALLNEMNTRGGRKVDYQHHRNPKGARNFLSRCPKIGSELGGSE